MKDVEKDFKERLAKQLGDGEKFKIELNTGHYGLKADNPLDKIWLD